MPARILVVDDQLFMRRTLAQLIRQNGWEVAGEASNGKEAIEMFSMLKPDLVLMDSRMPVVSGLDALRVIHKFDAAARVIMLTSVDDPADIQTARELGVLDYITKPYKKERVIASIRNAFAKIRILVVDDQLFIRRTLGNLIQENGWQLAGEATNGKEAIDLFSMTSPDLVIMDIGLPIVNGLEALKVIKHFESASRVIMLTSDNRQESINAAIQAGAEDYISKPFESERVVKAIKKAIAGLYEERIKSALFD
ncbi:MAG TPA: response regulator [Chroococcales cyanobacterium]|jgi:two-component system chemotaxis response regulator CheY